MRNNKKILLIGCAPPLIVSSNDVLDEFKALKVVEKPRSIGPTTTTNILSRTEYHSLPKWINNRGDVIDIHTEPTSVFFGKDRTGTKICEMSNFKRSKARKKREKRK